MPGRSKPYKQAETGLLNFNFSAGFGKLLLQLFCSSLIDAFFDRLRSLVNEVFRFFESQSGNVFYDFNDLELLSAAILEDHVERRFLSSSSGTTATTCSNSYSSSCRLDTVFIFQDFRELVYFFNRKVYELFCEGFNVCHFIWFLRN